MRGNWPELLNLAGTEIRSSEGKWTIRHSDVLEDQASTRLALLLDLERGGEIVSVRLLFPGEAQAVEHHHGTDWILKSLREIIDAGGLRQDGIYSIG